MANDQRRNQISRYDKKDVDANKATWEIPRKGVKSHNRQNRNRSQTIDVGSVDDLWVQRPLWIGQSGNPPAPGSDRLPPLSGKLGKRLLGRKQESGTMQRFSL